MHSVPMQKSVVALFALSLFATACGNAGIPNAAFADDSDTIEVGKAPSVKPDRSFAIEDELDFIDEWPTAAEEKVAPPPSVASTRQIGDISVQRFSGSFAEKPLTLTEEVVARAGSLIMIDYTLDEGGKATKLRVTHDVNTDRVLRVRELKGKKELTRTLDAYDAMVAKITFIPDGNEGEVAKEASTCLLGERAVDCEKTAYRVTVGGRSATFKISRGTDGSDISGEIATEDGTILYKAETVDVRKGMPSNVASR